MTGNDIWAAQEKAKLYASENDAFYVDQFNNISSVRAHYLNTGPEIYEHFGDNLTAFVASVGSGGTFIGTSTFLKEQSRSILTACVEPKGSEVLAGKPITRAKHIMQGTGYGVKVP